MYLEFIFFKLLIVRYLSLLRLWHNKVISHKSTCSQPLPVSNVYITNVKRAFEGKGELRHESTISEIKVRRSRVKTS